MVKLRIFADVGDFVDAVDKSGWVVERTENGPGDITVRLVPDRADRG